MNVPLATICVGLAVTSYTLARSPDDAPKLPAPSGDVTMVGNVDELLRAVAELKSGGTLVLRKGVYQLTRPIHFDRPLRNIELRGATGRVADVVIRGAGMNNPSVHHGVLADQVDGLLIADMTIGWVGYHPIALQPRCRRVRVYHCRLVDAGEQFIKGSSDGQGGGVDNGLVAHCILEYTRSGPPNGYTNGVDIHGGENWIIRDNLFRNIRTAANAQYKAVPAVLMWNGAKNTICEGNTFINCDRSIAFGLTNGGDGPDHEGGVIRNNFVYVQKDSVPNADAGITLASPETRVLHNTILLNGEYPNAIEARWTASRGIVVANNLTDAAIAMRDGAQAIQEGNGTRAERQLFRDAAAGDLHLRGEPTLGTANLHCPLDWDNDRRSSPRTAIGADALPEEALARELSLD